MLQSSLSFHFSVQVPHLVISITDKCTVTIESQYLKFFVVYYYHSWVLCAELCFVSTTTLQHTDFRNHIYLKYWGILSHVINTAVLQTSLMYWLLFRTDHDRLLAILAKYILSKETLCDIWLTINLRGKKICCAYLDCQPTWMKRIILPASNFI